MFYYNLMKILVTGCAGFIGSNLCEKLIELNTYEVYGLDINNLPVDFKYKDKIVFYKEDILNNDLVSIKNIKPDVVIHLAAVAGVSESCIIPKKYVDININGTINVIDNCIKNNVNKIIYASSSSIYGNTDNIDTYESTDTLQSPYSITKKCSEMIFDYYSRFYDLNILGLRFFSVYGPRCRKDMAPYIFINNILNDKPISINGDGNILRDFTYIDDIIDGILKSILYLNKNKISHQLFNLGNGNSITINNFIKKIENLTNKKAKINYDLQKKYDNLKTCADLKKSNEILNYKPKIDIELGLKLTIDYFIKNNSNIENNYNIENNSNEIKWDDTIEFTFPITNGFVIKVYDADTITIASKMPYNNSPMYRLSVRLNGIDTPEIKGKGISEEEKECAKQARDFVSKLVFNKYVKLENIQSEKYGRLLADVYIDGKHLNKLLIDNRYAIAYDGGTKIKPTSWSKYKLTGDLS